MKDVLTEIRKRIQITESSIQKGVFRIHLDGKQMPIAYFCFDDDYSIYAPFIQVSEPDYRIT